MTGPCFLTIYIAEGGTPYKNLRNGNFSKSLAGHMWYSIREGDGPEQSYGFASQNGKPFDAGKVVTDDIAAYYRPRHKLTMEITRDQYELFKDYSENGRRGKWDYFDGTYNVVTNSCMDFTWNALEHAGLQLSEPGSNLPVPITSDGNLLPSNNWDNVKRLANPAIPTSPYNRINYGPSS